MKNHLYEHIYSAILNHNTRIQLDEEQNADEIRTAIRCIMRDNPDIFWFAHQYHFDPTTSTLRLQYTFSADRTQTIQERINDVIDHDFCIEHVKTLTQQEQVTYVYKWLVTYCNYNPNSAYNQSIYSVFVCRNSVCTGYAKAAQYLFHQLGLESQLVFGRLHQDNETGRHCWNLVKVDNRFYHIDTCMGDSKLEGVAMMAGAQKILKIDNINYNFLCVSTDKILETRSIEDSDTLPSCPDSWSENLVYALSKLTINQRKDDKGCILSHTGSSADIYLCSKEKNTVLKVFRSDSTTACEEEYHYMQQTKDCLHLLHCKEPYTDISRNRIAIEQSTPLVDLLCSHYYELSLKGLLKMANDIANAWVECRNHGVLYRDIHICNLYRSNEGIFKLGDFGSCTNDFNAKEVVGNQWFMAPETFTDGIFTEASAVYSISLVMYFIFNNLQSAFWEKGHEDEALHKRIGGEDLELPRGCAGLPSELNDKLKMFFSKATVADPEKRISSINEFIHELEQLSDYCGNSNYIVHHKGTSIDFDLNSHTTVNYFARTHIPDIITVACISTDSTYQEYENIDSYEAHIVDNSKAETPLTADEIESLAQTMTCEPIEYECIPNYEAHTECDSCPFPSSHEIDTVADSKAETPLTADEIESFARTMACRPVDANASYATEQEGACYRANDNALNYHNKATYSPKVARSKEPIWKKLFGKKYNEVYSSVFAPAEVKRRSYFMVQVYLHLFEETEKVQSLAMESDKNAERRDYKALSLKLKRGDKVDIELNIYGETCLMNERKSIVWQGSFTKCNFVYFIPEAINVDELCCAINISINGAMIGDMKFITQIVEKPSLLNSEILSHRFNRIFISYAHQDAQQIKLLALAYKAQGVDYFYDRDSLKPGDVYEEKIFEYIDTSDLFVLCWSKNAAESKYVAKEKGRALLRAYPHLSFKEATLKICPISIEPRADLPDDMKKIYNFEVL